MRSFPNHPIAVIGQMGLGGLVRYRHKLCAFRHNGGSKFSSNATEVRRGRYCCRGSAKVLGSVKLPPVTVKMLTPMIMMSIPMSCSGDKRSCKNYQPR